MFYHFCLTLPFLAPQPPLLIFLCVPALLLSLLIYWGEGKVEWEACSLVFSLVTHCILLELLRKSWLGIIY